MAPTALDGLLLNPAEVNAALGATGMTLDKTRKWLVDDSDRIEAACLPVSAIAQDKVYTGSGWTALRIQTVREPVDDYQHLANQAVVAFPTARDAANFFAASQQAWARCAERRYTYNEPGQPPTVWTVGKVSDADGILTVPKLQEGGDGWSCQRALTTKNNVAVDIMTCSYNQTDTAAVTIARQIAEKVAQQ